MWNVRSMMGGILDGHSAYSLLRSLRTYDIRMEKTLANTCIVLDFLNAHDCVTEIYYPGLYANSSQNSLFQNEHYHGGGLLSFRVKDSIDLVKNIETLCSIKMAPSFGSVDTLIELPFFMSHWGKPRPQVVSLGIDEYLVRLSIGNEPIHFILDDIKLLLSC